MNTEVYRMAQVTVRSFFCSYPLYLDPGFLDVLELEASFSHWTTGLLRTYLCYLRLSGGSL